MINTAHHSRLKYLVLIFIGLLLPYFGEVWGSLYAQELFNQDPNNPNLDFSMGDFTHWELSWIKREFPNEVYEGPASVSSPVIVDVYGNNWDGNAGIGNLPRVPDGLEQVARFGDPAGGGLGNSKAYKMKYNITVNSDYPVLFIQMASLMDNNHEAIYNTHYKFTLKTASGNYIPTQPCTGIELYPTSDTNPEAQSNPPINYTLQPNPAGTYNYQPWESIAIDLSSYIGQTLSLEFEHYDCSYGYHGSYTYLSAAMRRKTTPVYYCKDATEIAIEPYPLNFKSYQWNTGETTESISVNSPVNETVYTVEVGSYNECSTTLSYVLKEINVEAGFTYECGSNKQVSFFDESTTNAGNIEEWSWNFNDPDSGNSTSGLANPSHTFSAPGSYEVSLTVTNSFGCTETYSTLIEVAPINEDITGIQNYLNQHPITFCENTTPDINEIENILNYIHSQIPDIVIDKTASQILSEFSQNNGQVAIKISREDLCGSETLYISYQTNPIPAISPITSNAIINVCWAEQGFYETFDLTPAGTEALGNLNPTDYTLGYYLTENSAEIGNTLSPEYITNPTSFANMVAYQQEIWLRVENSTTGCYAITSFQVRVLSSFKPVIESFNGNNLCVDYLTNTVLNEIELYIDTPSSDYNFQWYLDDVAIPNANTESYTITKAGNYKVEITSLNSGDCPSVFSENFTIDKSGPAVTTGEGFVLNKNGFSVLVEGFGNYVYSLSPNGPWQSSNELSVPAGNYTVYVKAINSNCEVIEINDIQTIYIPNFFTPNGDGINDYWQIEGLQYYNPTKVYIFDRFGKILTHFSTYGRWDGAYNGKPMPANDYWYMLQLNNKYLFKGHFTLKR